jgi:hypothetical protein
MSNLLSPAFETARHRLVVHFPCHTRTPLFLGSWPPALFKIERAAELGSGTWTPGPSVPTGEVIEPCDLRVVGRIVIADTRNGRTTLAMKGSRSVVRHA